MLGKRCRPVIRKLPDLIIAGGMSAQTEAILSPTSPLERDTRPPKGWRNRESEGVGLGILAALEKPGGNLSAKLVVGSCNFNLSSPIAINYSPRTMSRVKECLEGIELSRGSSGHASMTGHGLHQSPCKGIFCVDVCEESGDLMRWRENGFFYSSQPRFTEEVAPVFPVADFLNFCYLCRKKLHGRDIYMYRGEKAFCSMECRYRQIVSDEVQEKCGSKASKSSDISSSSPYSTGERLFYTGIMAA